MHMMIKDKEENVTGACRSLFCSSWFIRAQLSSPNDSQPFAGRDSDAVVALLIGQIDHRIADISPDRSLSEHLYIHENDAMLLKSIDPNLFTEVSAIMPRPNTISALVDLIAKASKIVEAAYEQTEQSYVPSLDDTEPHPLDTQVWDKDVKKAIQTIEGACAQLCATLAKPDHTLMNVRLNYMISDPGTY